MLWWDDDVARTGIKVPELENTELLEPCYRNTGSVPIIRKVSKCYAPPIKRKLSTPVPPPVVPRPLVNRKLSCPAPSQRLSYCKEECLPDVSLSPPPSPLPSVCAAKPRNTLHPKNESLVRAIQTKAKVKEGKEKTITREPDVRKELKRGSMRDKWGISLVYRLEGGRLELAVSKVTMFSPAAKAGLMAGNTLILVNDWKIEAMDHSQTALSVFLAAGFSVHLAWLTTTACLDGWGHLEVL